MSTQRIQKTETSKLKWRTTRQLSIIENLTHIFTVDREKFRSLENIRRPFETGDVSKLMLLIRKVKPRIVSENGDTPTHCRRHVGRSPPTALKTWTEYEFL